MNIQGPNQSNYLAQSIPFIIGLLFLIIEAIFSPIKTTLTSFFLFGAWMGDLYLKSSLGFGKETCFADLNFAALAFVASRFVALVGDTHSDQDPIALLQILIIIFLFAFSWVINLNISRDISNPNPFLMTTVGKVSWFASGFISFASAFAVIILQEMRII